MRAIAGKCLFKINVRQRETLAFDSGLEIYQSHGWNFNLRQDRGTRGYCVSCEGIPEGAQILVNYLAMEKSYDMPYQHEFLTEKEIAEGYQVRNIPKDMIFAFMENEEWEPFENVLLTKRIFRVYDGPLVGIEPEQVKNRLYIVKGFDTWDGEKKDLSGMVCAVTLNSDYEIHWHSEDHKPRSLIRTLHREIEAVDYGLTDEVKSGKLLVGHESKDAKPLNELVHG